MNFRSTLPFLLVCISSFTAFSQTVLRGHIDSDDGDVIGAAVLLFKDDVQVKATPSDFDGNYIISNLEPGIYELRISSLGLKSQLLEDVIVAKNSASEVDVFLEMDYLVLDCVTITDCNLSNINICYNTSGCYTSSTKSVEFEEIENKTTLDEGTIIDIFPNPCVAGDHISILANVAFDELRVYNLAGSLVNHKQTELTKNLNLATPLDAGVYVIQFLKDGIPFDGSQQIILID